MTASVSCGYPLFVDGATYTAAQWREFDGGTAVQDAGTPAAVAPASGVYVATGTALKVTAPVGGMTVNVAAGYWSCANSSGTGAYRSGLMSSASLTVASNSTGSTRKDYVLAEISDSGAGSGSSIAYVTGTTSVPAVPANAIILAEVDVTNGAVNITSGMITDKRTFAVAPGGIVPVPTFAQAVPGPSSQLMWDIADSELLYVPTPPTIVKTFTSSGSWTPPTGITHAYVECWGGGGGGGQTTGSTKDGAGGGGEYAAEPAYAVTPGTPISFTVGTGGTGGTDSVPSPAAGTATSFNSGAIVANPGGGGVSAGAGSNTAAGGTGSSNTIHFPGGAGGAQQADQPNGGGGGGGSSGGPGGAGNAGANTSTNTPGAGGAAPVGGGAGGNGGTRFGFGGAGGFPGGGGGASGDGASELIPGGRGGGGWVRITYTEPTVVTQYQLLSQAAWYARNPSTSTIAETFGGVTGVIALTMTADGVSDYEIDCFAFSAIGAFFGVGYGQLAIYVDSVQVDAINFYATTSSSLNLNWTYYTSGAQGTTMSAGSHVITLAVRALRGTFVEVAGPASLRVAQVVT